MKIIENNIIPFGNSAYVNIFGVIFSKCGKDIHPIRLNHEAIHTAQMKEMLYVFFYIWYCLEWFAKLFVYGFSKKAYYNISFERETYENERDLEYLNKRKRFAWLKRIF